MQMLWIGLLQIEFGRVQFLQLDIERLHWFNNVLDIFLLDWVGIKFKNVKYKFNGPYTVENKRIFLHCKR